MTTSSNGIRRPTRRALARGLGATGVALATGASVAHRAFAQTRAPVNLSFWMFENPQQRPWVQKRVRQFTEQNPQHALAGAAQLPGMLLAHDHATASESSAPKRRSRAANWFSASVSAARSKSGHSVSRNRSSA